MTITARLLPVGGHVALHDELVEVLVLLGLLKVKDTMNDDEKD